jgi:hypothetical protein
MVSYEEGRLVSWMMCARSKYRSVLVCTVVEIGLGGAKEDESADNFPYISSFKMHLGCSSLPPCSALKERSDVHYRHAAGRLQQRLD